MSGRDITTPEEYARAVAIFPDDIRAYVEPNIHLIEEVAVDLNALLKVRVDGLRITYPLRVTATHLKATQQVVGKYTTGGRAGIEQTLHRVAGGKDGRDIHDKLTLRVARVIYGVADEMRDLVVNASGIAVIGPPAVGKTTLLRDIARIRLETLGAGLVIIDSIGELCGHGAIPHPLLSEARIFPVGEPSRQGPQMAEAIRGHGPEEVLTDEVQRDDIPVLLEAFNNGTSVVCSLHGRSVRNIVKHHERQALLGLVENPRDGSVTAQDEPLFSLIIEAHGKGLFRVITDVPAAVEAGLQRKPIDYRYFGPWTSSFRHERLKV